MSNPIAAAASIIISPANSEPPTVVYVDTAAGSDSNDGLSALTAKQTLAAAVALLTIGGTCNIVASSAAPLREMYQYGSAFPITLQATVPGTAWYMHASIAYASGWTSAGGGVYSRTAPVATIYSVAVSTLHDAHGLWRRLQRNTSTPTTPAAGQFGVSGGTLYVHLPSSADANSHIIEVARYDQCVEASGGATLTLSDGVFRFGNMGTVVANGGRIVAEDCVAQYGSGLTGSWATRNGYSKMTLTDCVGEGSYNDGFNHHATAGVASEMTLIDCVGRYNDDEGASPHDDTVFTVSGGRFHHNGSGGITAVNRCVIDIDGATCDYNNQAGYNSQWGGVAALGFVDGVVSGSVTNCILRNNDGPGLYLAAGHTITQSANLSGLAEGNSDPDTV